MAESIVQVAPDSSGKKLHTWNYTVGANTVEDEFTVPGEYPYPTYSFVAKGATVATGADHMLQIMAGSSLKVRIRKIEIHQSAVGTAAAFAVSLLRLTTAGTTGTALTARPYDTSSAAAGATAIINPTVKGTEGVELIERHLPLAAAAPIINAHPTPFYLQHPYAQPLVIPAGTSNGIAIKSTGGGIPTDTVDILVEFVETAF